MADRYFFHGVFVVIFTQHGRSGYHAGRFGAIVFIFPHGAKKRYLEFVFGILFARSVQQLEDITQRSMTRPCFTRVTRHMAHGTRHMAHGTWHMAPGTPQLVGRQLAAEVVLWPIYRPVGSPVTKTWPLFLACVNLAVVAATSFEEEAQSGVLRRPSK